MISECHPKGTKNVKNAGVLGTGKKQLGSWGPIWKPVGWVLHSRSCDQDGCFSPSFLPLFFSLRISSKTVLDTQITHIINIYMFEFWTIEGNQVCMLTFHVMLLKIKGIFLFFLLSFHWIWMWIWWLSILDHKARPHKGRSWSLLHYWDFMLVSSL